MVVTSSALIGRTGILSGLAGTNGDSRGVPRGCVGREPTLPTPAEPAGPPRTPDEDRLATDSPKGFNARKNTLIYSEM